MAGERTSRGSNFDVLRLMAAGAVVFGHALLVTVGSDWWSAHPTNPFHEISDDALAVFFVVSGILVTQSWLRDPDFGRYLARRAVRLLPALLAVVAITSLAIGPLVSTLAPSSYFTSPGTWAHLLNSTLFVEPYQLPGVFAHLPVAGAVNGSLWTLRYEFLCYLMVPLVLALVAVVRRRAAVLVVAVAVAGMATSALVTHADYVIVGTNPTSIAALPGAAGWNMLPLSVLTTYFLAGMCIQMWLSRIRFDWRLAALAIPLFIVASQTAALFPLSVVTLAYAVAYFGLAARPVSRRLVARGDASYGIYVWGFVVEQLIVLAAGPHVPAIAIIAIALPVTWAIGLLSWRFVEKPALRFKPRVAVTGTPLRHGVGVQAVGARATVPHPSTGIMVARREVAQPG